MSLQNIIQKIQQETQAEIKKIEAETKKTTKELETEYQTKIEAKKKILLDAKKQQLEKLADQELFQNKLKNNAQILEKKRKTIDQVYKMALDELLELNDKQYIELISQLIYDLPELENGQIQPAKNKVKLTQQALNQSQRNFELIEENEKIKGGFIFVSPKINIDNSFEQIIKRAQQETEEKIAKTLFN
ncbi:MAG: V-type ATP synthase subunit E [Patescibacteria group bacterium]|nr:V-type ATP synthase subunit E [Patescibacteria group bacterium]